MRAAAALGFLLALGVWVGHALAAPPGPTQLPTTSLPITTVIPSLPTTVPPLPTSTTVPAPPKLPTTTTIPAPPKLPTTTTVPAPPTATSVPQIVSPATTATGASSGPSVPSAVQSAGSSTSSAGPGAGYSGAKTGQEAGAGGSEGQGQSSRPYVARSGPKNKRRVILSFALSQDGRVYFVVKQVSPACRVVGRFSVRGHQGTNRVRFTGKVAGKPLSVGTYLISATTRDNATVLRLTLVVVERERPTAAALRAARAANVCPPDSFLAAVPGVGANSAIGFAKPTKPGTDTRFPGSGDDSTSKSAGAVLGSALERAAAEAVKPLAVTLLGLAILLLGLAAAPKAVVPGPRLNDALARHRPEIAAAGAAAMVTGILYFLIS